MPGLLHPPCVCAVIRRHGRTPQVPSVRQFPLGCHSSPSSVWLPSTAQSVRCPAALAHRCRPPSSARHTDFVDLADQVRCCTCTPHFCWRCAAGPSTFRAGLIAGPSCGRTGSWIFCRINHAGVVVRLLVGWAEVLVRLCIG